MHLVQEVVQPRVHLADLARVVIAQEVVERAERIGQIPLGAGVHHGNALARVGVRHRQVAPAATLALRTACDRQQARGGHAGRAQEEVAAMQDAGRFHGVIRLKADIDGSSGARGWRRRASSWRSWP
jgi:hypothetical protein